MDYAWADPVEKFAPGQTESSPENLIAKEGSLGFLALGAAGLMLRRQRRQA